MIAGEIRSHGVTLEIAREAASVVDEAEAAWRTAERRLQGLSRLDDGAAAARLSGYLQRRGFGWSVTRSTVERAMHALGRRTTSDDLTDVASE
jgi:regulatory protein